jgi:hypothetical protein
VTWEQGGFKLGKTGQNCQARSMLFEIGIAEEWGMRWCRAAWQGHCQLRCLLPLFSFDGSPRVFRCSIIPSLTRNMSRLWRAFWLTRCLVRLHRSKLIMVIFFPQRSHVVPRFTCYSGTIRKLLLSPAQKESHAHSVPGAQGQWEKLWR